MDTGVSTRKLVTKLSLLVLVMFGFGYALVPLYNTLCTVTGLNGKTGRLSEATAAAMPKDDTRLITVEFVTNVNSGMPWRFKPLVTRIAVHPGVETAVDFEVMNTSSDAITGQAVPSLAPNEVARYFSKTECFCFTQQTLAAGETRRMPVRFIVNPKIPAHVDVLTLSYTFFRAAAQVTAATPTVKSVPNS
ncbi:MAG: cytochrome c oxidase assembly protein [Gammaproteobacteria bacterium]|nr:cytochrome c oxidase assembly protein [Gammaproteobacteria bacterium]